MDGASEVRARRRHRRPDDHLHQHHRRHRSSASLQHGLTFGEAADTYTLLTVGDGLVTPDPGADHLDRRRPAGVQGRRRRLGRQGAVRPAQRLSRQRSACRRPCCSSLWAAARHAVPPLPGTGRGDRIRGLVTCRAMRERQSKAMAANADGGRGTPLPADEPIANSLVDRRGAARAGLRPAVADQYGHRGLPPDRSDQGAAPPACRRNRIRHAVGAHPGQHAAPAQQLHGADQGDRVGARRHPAQHAAGDGPARQGDLAARRGHGGADIRPARHVDRAELPRGSFVQGSDRGRSPAPSSRPT